MKISNVTLDDLDAVLEVVETLCDVLNKDMYVHAELQLRIENIAARARYIRREFGVRNTDKVIQAQADAVSALKNWNG